MVTARDSNAPKVDRRVRRTQAALQRTLIRLVEEQDLSQITIADVAEHAEVSRSAFYGHYRDVHELAEAACTAMIDDLIESLPALGPACHDQDPTRSLQAFFANLAEHAGLYRSLLGPQGSARVIDHVRRRITEAVHAAACPTTAAERASDDGGNGNGGHADEPAASASGLPLDVPAAFTAGALIGVAADWLGRGCPRTPAEMAASTWPLLAALHRVDDGTPTSRQLP
ncbi:TetR/AcrR family transcriptional regulator [Nonomuraea sp. NPDC049400]|uniref:TetR/AcrR family transcriptional regulator n=1 Tax=Nonomuraea sp. NPDC049400 TaxID=3364352 RepID=UPI0037A54F41